jgi:hypothetical protein
MDEFVNTIDLFLQCILHALEGIHGVNDSRVVPVEIPSDHGVRHVNTVTIYSPAKVMSWDNDVLFPTARL